jgi:hypothetical protein
MGIMQHSDAAVRFGRLPRQSNRLGRLRLSAFLLHGLDAAKGRSTASLQLSSPPLRSITMAPFRYPIRSIASDCGGKIEAGSWGGAERYREAL